MDTFGNQHRTLCALGSGVGLYLPPSTTHPLHRGALGSPAQGSPSDPQILLPELGALRIHLQLPGSESTVRGCVSTPQAPAAPVPQALRHSPLLGQMQIPVQASSILTACRRALPGHGAHKTLPGATQLAQHWQDGRELLWETNPCPWS